MFNLTYLLRKAFVILLFLFTLLLSEIAYAKCVGKFKVYSPSNKEYFVEVQFFTGYELNSKTRSYNYENEIGYAEVWWGQGQVTIIKLNYSLVKFGFNRQVFDCSIIELWQQMMPNELMEGYDQQDRKWMISLSISNQSTQKFNPYVSQGINTTNTSDYTAAAIAVGALAVGALVAQVIKSSPEAKIRRADARIKREDNRLERKLAKKRALKTNSADYSNNTPSPKTRTSQYQSSSEKEDYLYITTIEISGGSLRNYPDSDSNEIYNCPKGATVYVLSKVYDKYYRIKVNGYVGYIFKNYLTKYW